jgi:hypothetical protein
MTALDVKKTGLDTRAHLLTLAWAATVFASLLPLKVWTIFSTGGPEPAVWFQLGALTGLLIVSLLYTPARVLRGYLFLLLAIVLSDSVLRPFIAGSRVWQGWFAAGSGGWFGENLDDQILRLLPAVMVWLLLMLMGFRRHDYYMAKGDLNAAADPVRWLDIKAGDRWKKTGISFLLMMVAVTAVVMGQSLFPHISLLSRVLPFLPAILLFAAVNAFNENFVYRAGLLPVLLPVFGKGSTLLLIAALFGLGHLDFAVMSVFGFLLTGMLGWIAAKSMVETRGFLWAWLIQFPLDIFAFTSLLLVMLARG